MKVNICLRKCEVLTLCENGTEIDVDDQIIDWWHAALQIFMKGQLEMESALRARAPEKKVKP
jgi:hypothetical protein